MNRGKLTIFLGMAPGVGKTYAMLQAALEQHRAGIDVVIGYVETHQRTETAALVSSLPLLPRQKIKYQNTSFEELDLDAVLNRKPAIVLIDELAHSNIPGSLHEKRWQDIRVVLESGIDVYTTLNIQHVESRSEEVQSLAHVPIYETVPDLILEEADQIRLIDLSPAELLQRLHEGKVYLPHKIQHASDHFFKPETLAALRELVLRFTAEKVDKDLQRTASFQTKKTIWNLNERLMVAVSHSPASKILIRTARRLAYSLGAPWIAVYVNQGLSLQNEEREQLSRNLELAKNLGAEVLTTLDTDLIESLKRIAIEKNVSKIVTGRSLATWRTYFRPSLSQKFVQELPFLDVYVVKTPLKLGQSSSTGLNPIPVSFKGIYLTLILLIGITTLSLFIVPFIGYRAIGFLFLLGILSAGTFASVQVIFGSAFISALVWDLVFIPPQGTLTIQQPEDIAMCCTFLGVASLIGLFSYKLKIREALLKQKEKQTFLLYQTAHCFSRSSNLDDCMFQLNTLIQPVLSIQLNLMPPVEEKEKAVFEWVQSNKKTAGWSTDTLPSAMQWHIPLLIQNHLLGVLSVLPLQKQKFLPDEKALILTISEQIAVYLQKLQFEESAAQAKHLEESEKLYDLILNCISHELKTPLTSILGNLEIIKKEVSPDTFLEIQHSAHRLKHIIENLLEISKLSSGHITLHEEWIDLEDVISHVLRGLESQWDTHRIHITMEDNFPLIWGDAVLIERLLENVILNSLQYSPPPTPIQIEAHTIHNELTLSITDQGPGIPPEYQSTIFEKFFRVPNSKSGGSGLGLSICKQIIELHQGSISIDPGVKNGSRFVIKFPYREIVR